MSAAILRDAAKVLREKPLDTTLSPQASTALADLLDASASSWGLQHKAGLSGCRNCTMKRPNGHGPCPACLAEDVARLILGGAS